jgi:hypothetical protein
VLPHHPPRVRQTSLNDCSATMADRNTRLGRRLSEHVAAVGGYSVCVVVGGHPVEGLPRLRVQRHDSTQHDPQRPSHRPSTRAHLTRSAAPEEDRRWPHPPPAFRPEPNQSVSSPLTVGATPSVRKKMTPGCVPRWVLGLPLNVTLSAALAASVACLLRLTVKFAIDGDPFYERGPHLDPTRRA